MHKLLNTSIHSMRSTTRMCSMTRHYAKAKADPSKFIKKKKFLRVRDVFPTEAALQQHLAQKIVDNHPENYGRDGWTLELPFYKDERASIAIKPRSEYPDWLFKEELYQSWSLAELEQERIANGGSLPDDLNKIYDRLSRAAKVKLHNKYGKKWKTYYEFVLSGEIKL